MKPSELKRLSDEELEKELTDAQQAVFDARFQLSTRQLKNFRAMREARRRVARVLTVKKERQLAGAGEAAAKGK
ncbi:MAG TPA: 50S ribosomal protein L29 [Candidatus Limnocylindria bacterium]|nr:50S ribosomal protein L29 [Candidatus Limnocylindria bacterium]